MSTLVKVGWVLKSASYHKTEIDKAIINVSQSIKKLESNISDYPQYVTDAINEINSELSAQGITAKVRTFAELVESISTIVYSSLGLLFGKL